MMKADVQSVERDTRSFRFLFSDFTFSIRAWVTAVENRFLCTAVLVLPCKRKRTCGCLNREVTGHSFIMNSSPLFCVPSFF